MSVLLQISDPHFGTEQPPVVEALAALARQQRPDLLVLSGDITQRARPAQFQAARSFMDRLGAPLLAVPGNHDIPLFSLWTRLRTKRYPMPTTATIRNKVSVSLPVSPPNSSPKAMPLFSTNWR